MPQIWKEPYNVEAALDLGIRDLEGGRIVRWDERGIQTEWDERPDLEPACILFVQVCGFTFGFFSRAMLLAYLEHFEQKVQPSRIRDTPHCNHDMRQDVFTRLPLYLREEPKRLRVVKALQKALEEFRS